MASSDSEKLLKFPSLFPDPRWSVAMAQEGFEKRNHACVLDLVPDFDPESRSKTVFLPKATIQSVTVRVICSQEHLDRYLALNKIDGVKLNPLTAAANDDQSPPVEHTAL